MAKYLRPSLPMLSSASEVLLETAVSTTEKALLIFSFDTFIAVQKSPESNAIPMPQTIMTTKLDTRVNIKSIVPTTRHVRRTAIELFQRKMRGSFILPI